MRDSHFGGILLATALLTCGGCGFFSAKYAEESGLEKDSRESSDLERFAALDANQWLNLSRSYFSEKKYLESIGAAETALYFNRDMAEAYNNIGAAYAALHLWDPAIQAAQQALRLNPDFVLARNNLAWALEQKRLAAH